MRLKALAKYICGLSELADLECSTDSCLIFAFMFAYSLATSHLDTGADSASEVDAVLPLTKRQREILDYLNEFIQQHGYAPSLEEIGRRFNLSSLATVHKHLTNLQEKGFIRRAWNRSRSVEVVPTRGAGRAIELPLLGFVAAGAPIEAVAGNETIAVPEALVGKRDSYVLRVKGDSMIDEQIRDGDFVIVEDRKSADNGEMVIALVGGLDVTLKKFYRENGKIRSAAGQPGDAADHGRSRPRAGAGRRRRRDAEVLTARSTSTHRQPDHILIPVPGPDPQ